ncbi:amidohydrolase family protein [Prescottella agglutinans]|uniref:2-amino-3-carboxymuconate-6-semialdehyde decarboxylase n=1 Tax=Prescottella agglutinans TaxID=1644129 RepID=A0ABT6MK34_9NOCA|nr:amidohydrolase family protein [Prescottella agglutinans]MDH6284166.1 aminocarboxymuconate-semialdehyde decarboxylase [Prescottella agglutinans]
MDLSAELDQLGGIDAHAHYFGTDLTDALGSVHDARWPYLVTDGTTGTIMLGDKPFRTVRSALWDVDERIRELDAAGIALQVISPVPVLLAYWADHAAAARYAAVTNDSIAAAVDRSHGRLVGLGTVPLPHVDGAITELRRAVLDLGLRGVEIGTQIAGHELDSPHLEPFFAAAEALGATLFIHPTDGGGGVVRRDGQPYDFGLGMTTDTAIAATSLVFGGVLDRYPDLRIFLAHGCGTFAWTYPRLRLGAQIWHQADPVKLDRLTKSLWVDSLVFDPEHLRLLVHRFGADRLVLGTDYPFIPGQLDHARDFIESAHAGGALTASQATGLLDRNAYALLGIEAPTRANPSGAATTHTMDSLE